MIKCVLYYNFIKISSFFTCANCILTLGITFMQFYSINSSIISFIIRIRVIFCITIKFYLCTTNKCISAKILCIPNGIASNICGNNIFIICFITNNLKPIHALNIFHCILYSSHELILVTKNRRC